MNETKSSGQVRLPIQFLRELDRNFSKGGRSFYFFDFDDNLVHLPTEIVIFKKSSGLEQSISTHLYAKILPLLGVAGSEWEDWELRPLDPRGSFRSFRDQAGIALDEQPLIKDMAQALSHSFLEWRGPSWDFFVHAVNNGRPISVITARGHHPHTIRRAINMLVQARELEFSPNFLSVYPVSHPETRVALGDASFQWSPAQLKKSAIKAATRDAFECFGKNAHHRFGMSDDDPLNLALIRSAMIDLKKENPENAFYVINTFERQLIKEEVIHSDTQDTIDAAAVPHQIPLF